MMGCREVLCSLMRTLRTSVAQGLVLAASEEDWNTHKQFSCRSILGEVTKAAWH